MAGWNDAKQEAEEAATGIWLKLQNNGDKTKFVILGEPYPYMRPNFNGVLAKRFLLEVYVLEEHAAKVWETNPSTFKLLCSLGDEIQIGTNGEQPARAVLLKRNGAKGDPGTTYLVLDGGPLTQEQWDEASAAPATDLSQIAVAALEKDSKPREQAPAPRQAAPSRQQPAPARSGNAQGYQRPVNARPALAPTPAAGPAPVRQPAPVASAPQAAVGAPPQDEAPPDGEIDGSELPF